MINFIWLIALILSLSWGIIAIYLLAAFNVQILSWTIGYIVMSGTNDLVLMPSLVVAIICIVVFMICLFKNQLLKLIAAK
ncbi:hypothetical protein LOSG293_370040 [Secundilactobacillus oryzae JCM 18671]|uniref:Uncharacterized protein n=1 Tax=Secundilactobacillus oryzae JCM 18671 TaxID=1291743 RepID=A0A081BKH8_9LACO|nr:hypothetical protein [Secundilactobacillus oryzae]GAK48546.1 hypothetical protein LOSG293_370040 [Secundilactobacillus oryzae JCM 18671]